MYNIRNSSTLADSYIVDIYEEKNLTKFFRETKIDKKDFYNTCLIIYEWWLYNIIADKVICMIESSKLMEDLIQYMESKINIANNILIIKKKNNKYILGYNINAILPKQKLFILFSVQIFLIIFFLNSS